MKQLLVLIAALSLSYAASAKVAVCKAVVDGKNLTLEVLNRKQGVLQIEEPNGDKVKCDLNILTFKDMRHGVISAIKVDFVREFQCSPTTRLETAIPRELEFTLLFDSPESVRGQFKWKNYEPRAACEVQELDLAPMGMAAFKGTLKRQPAAKSSKEVPKKK